LVVTLANPKGDMKLTGAYLLCDQGDEDRLIKVISRRANSVEVEVDELPDYRILTFLDAHYPGWKAYVDGEPTPIYLANDAFKAILVPPGTHRVRFVFRPWRVYVGMVVSGGTFIGCAGLLLAGWMRARRSCGEGTRAKC